MQSHSNGKIFFFHRSMVNCLRHAIRGNMQAILFNMKVTIFVRRCIYTLILVCGIFFLFLISENWEEGTRFLLYALACGASIEGFQLIWGDDYKRVNVDIFTHRKYRTALYVKSALTLIWALGTIYLLRNFSYMNSLWHYFCIVIAVVFYFVFMYFCWNTKAKVKNNVYSEL